MDNLFKTKDTPILIAGPCSVESREGLQKVTASLLALPEAQRPLLIRGGVWKPRTRPGGFEGLGEEALQWMADLRKEHPTARLCCEVARPSHVELCLRYGVDAVWIGSRTTGDPFSVGEICRALDSTTLAVMVKNPLTPDVNLWLGALERVQQAGITDIAAVHRGFFTYNNMGYRNNPLWEVPIELKRLLPDMPLLCDPSHIGGDRTLLPQLMQTALDLHFDGLMVEVHHDPSQALTDAAQQLTPDELHTILSTLHSHHEPEPPDTLKLLRQQIDAIDAQLIRLLGERLDVARRIADVKAENNMPVFQPKRWEEVLQRKMQIAAEAGINPQFIKSIYEKIHSESIRVQLASPPSATQKSPTDD